MYAILLLMSLGLVRMIVDMDNLEDLIATDRPWPSEPLGALSGSITLLGVLALLDLGRTSYRRYQIIGA